ncbi:MAG TPA: DUF3014 domain-containing protein [Vicinamibacteria bacterium]|nr:DUF3014 domain-containing protein [Vicinamibacteria bacterium]
MPDLDSFELRTRPEPDDDGGTPQYEPPEERSFGFLVLVGALVTAAGVGGYFLYRAKRAPAPPPVTAMARATPTPIPGPEAMGLPSLERSDDFVRGLLGGLSANPQLGLWLAQQGLVRLLVNVVETVGKGESPRASLGFMAPSGPFKIAQRKGRTVVDEKSFARYDRLAEAVASLDAPGCARAFRRALPLLEGAYRELGYPEGGFERALREAVAHLLETPVVAVDVAVKPVRRGNVLVYEYADPTLEALSPAQKHLLRMGPSNVERVQGTLRALVAALGS